MNDHQVAGLRRGRLLARLAVALPLAAAGLAAQTLAMAPVVQAAPITTSPSADLAVAATGSATTTAGDPANLAYTITVTNNGPSDAQGVVLADALPAGETLVAQSQASGAPFTLTSTATGISDTAATLAAGASASFTVTAHVSPSVPEGTALNNAATVSSNTTDPDPTNNSSTASTGVHAFADLAVTNIGPATTIAGDPANLDYSITVTNNGPSDAQNVSLSDALPAGETLETEVQLSGPPFIQSVSGDSINDVIATLPAGASASFIVRAHVSPSVLEGLALVNAAVVGSSTFDPGPTNNLVVWVTDVHVQADLAVTNTGPAETIAGDPANLAYTIAVTNNGPSDAQNVSLSDALPAGETLVSQSQASGPPFTLSSTATGINDTAATLAAGASASFTVVVHLSASLPEGTVLSNAATVSSTTDDPAPGNNSSTAATLVHASDGPITITHITAGANHHQQAAAGVTFTDDDPAGNLSQYSGAIAWGDGTTTAIPHSQFVTILSRFGAGFAAGDVHTYARGGTYTVTITINDVGGASATASATLNVPGH